MSWNDAWRLVRIPGAITLAVTLLRLAGELMGGSEKLFNRAAGGPLAVVGIVWLVPVFGIYFGLRLARAGQGPPSRGRAIGLAFAGLACWVVLGVLWSRLGLAPMTEIFLWSASGAVSAAIAYQGWIALGRALLAYGLVARVPVIVVMLLAILGNWGTHYELGRPDLAPIPSPLFRWFVIGLVPQLGLWVPFTMVVGGLLGGFTALAARPRAS